MILSWESFNMSNDFKLVMRDYITPIEYAPLFLSCFFASLPSSLEFFGRRERTLVLKKLLPCQSSWLPG